MQHPGANTVLVLGIVSIVACHILGPFAWAKGSQVLREIDTSRHVRYTNRGTAKVGLVLGIISSVLLIVAALAVLVAIILFATGSVVTRGGSVSECRAERDRVDAAVEAFNAQIDRYPTSIDQLLRDGTYDGVAIRAQLAARPRYWTLSEAGNGALRPISGVDLPDGCT